MSEEGKGMDMGGVGKGPIIGNGFWCTLQPPQCEPPHPPPHTPYRQTCTERSWSNRGINGAEACTVWMCVHVCVCACAYGPKGTDATAMRAQIHTLVRPTVWKIGPPMHNWLLIHCILLKPSIYQALQFQGPWKKHFASTLQNTLKKISSLHKCSLTLTANSRMFVEVTTQPCRLVHLILLYWLARISMLDTRPDATYCLDIPPPNTSTNTHNHLSGWVLMCESST